MCNILISAIFLAITGGSFAYTWRALDTGVFNREDPEDMLGAGLVLGVTGTAFVALVISVVQCLT